MGRVVYEVCRISQIREAKTSKRKELNTLIAFLSITAILSNSR